MRGEGHCKTDNIDARHLHELGQRRDGDDSETSLVFFDLTTSKHPTGMLPTNYAIAAGRRRDVIFAARPTTLTLGAYSNWG